MEFGDRLKILRKQMNMTQEEVGSAVGVSYCMISLYEHGISEPPVRTALKLAQLFHTSVETLFGETVYVRSEEERRLKQENIRLRRALMAVKMELDRQGKTIMGELLEDRRNK